MMKAVCITFFLAHSAVAQLKPHPQGMTLRQWMSGTSCLNVASQPLMNTQFAQLGALDALHDAGMLKKVTGYSGVSSGAFVMALAATKNFSENSRKFRQIWPGWSNIVPEHTGLKMQDPYLSAFYEKRVLSKVLPASFEELSTPLAVVAVGYDDDTAAEKVDATRAQPIVASDGALAEAVIVSSSAMMGKGCPKCESGFQAKEFKGHWPAADGFLMDEYGTLGLTALAPCDNLLHFQPQNFAQQLTPTKNANLDTHPKTVVSLGLDVPSSGIMSMLWDGLLKPINRIRKFTLQGSVPLKGLANQDEVWEKIQYETAYDHMMERLDQPMQYDPRDEEEHHFVDLHLKQHWDQIRGWGERKWDQKFDYQHTVYWDQTAERRNKLVNDRFAKIDAGKLSYKPCGNGLGAPKCNNLKQKVPEFYKGMRIPTMEEAQGPAPSDAAGGEKAPDLENYRPVQSKLIRTLLDDVSRQNKIRDDRQATKDTATGKATWDAADSAAEQANDLIFPPGKEELKINLPATPVTKSIIGESLTGKHIG